MAEMKNKKLVLENGTVFEGYGFGADRDAVAELVFNSSRVGYQEIVSENSYYEPQFKYSDDLGGQHIEKTDEGDEHCYREGDTIYAFGSPIGFTSTLSQGIISSADREVDGRLCVQHDASITHGNSGSPLINEFGEVIGVNTFTYEDSQNLNFAVAISELDNLYF